MGCIVGYFLIKNNPLEIEILTPFVSKNIYHDLSAMLLMMPPGRVTVCELVSLRPGMSILTRTRKRAYHKQLERPCEKAQGVPETHVIIPGRRGS
jgi:hypothetical protein